MKSIIYVEEEPSTVLFWRLLFSRMWHNAVC